MSADTLPLRRIDHVRFFVGNARQSAYFLTATPLALRSWDMRAWKHARGTRPAMSCARKYHLCFGLPAQRPALRKPTLILHGDGVQDIALEVDDVKYTYNEAVRRGAVGVVGPTVWRMSTASTNTPRFAPTATPPTASSTATVTPGRFFAPGYKPIDPDRYSPTTFSHSA